LGILETFIKQKWNLLNQNDKNSLRNFLVDILIYNVNDDKLFAQNSFLINKLNNVIVLIAKNEWTSGWPNFISELCTSGKTSQNLCENNMKLLQLLSEEINEFWKSSLTTKKSN
jgi:exportin-1